MPYKLKSDKRKSDRRRYVKRKRIVKLRRWMLWHERRSNAQFRKRLAALVKDHERKEELKQVYFKAFRLHTPEEQSLYDKASPLLASVLANMLTLPGRAEHVANAALPQF